MKTGNSQFLFMTKSKQPGFKKFISHTAMLANPDPIIPPPLTNGNSLWGEWSWEKYVVGISFVLLISSTDYTTDKVTLCPTTEW